MHVYDAAGLPGAELSFLQDLVNQWNRPLRVFRGGGRTYSPEAFDTGAVAWDRIARDRAYVADLTADEAKAEGLTVVICATVGAPHYGELAPTEEFFESPAAYERFKGEYGTAWYDCMTPPDRLLLGEFIEIGAVKYGEVIERTIIFYHYSPYNLAGCDPAKVLGEPLERSMNPEFIERVAVQRRSYNLNRFQEYCKITTNEGLNEVRNRITKFELDYAEGTRRAAHARAKLREDQRFLDALIKQIDQDGERTDFEAEWEKVNANPLVTSLDFNDANELIVMTKPVQMKHPNEDRSVELGPFKWTINIDSSQILVENMGNPRGGFDHPHVNRHRPCFGEMGNSIHSLISTGQIHGAIGMIFAFLQSINLVDDWSRRASWWFDDDKAEEREAAVVGAAAIEATVDGVTPALGEPDDEDYYADDDEYADDE